MRGGSGEAVTLSVTANGSEIGTLEIPPGPWSEPSILLPASVTAASTPLTVTARGSGDPRFHSFHYWFYATP